MKRWLWRAFLVQALGEARDDRTLYAIGALALAAAVAIAGTSFEPAPIADVVRRELTAVEVPRPGLPPQTYFAIEVERVEPDAALGPVGLSVDIAIASPALARALLADLRAQARSHRGVAALAATAREPRRDPLGPAELTELFDRLCAPRGLGPVDATPLKGVGRYRLRLAPPHPGEVSGGGRASLLFGWATVDLTLFGTQRSYHELLLYFQGMVANWLGGAFAMALAIVFVARDFPTLLAPGGAEHVLARPHSRRAVFWARWSCSVAVFALLPLLLVGGAFLAVGLRAGLWNWPYLLAIPLVVLQFACMSALAALFGVWTRSATAATLASFLAWGACGLANLARGALVALRASGLDQHPSLRAPDWFASGVEALYWVLPSFGDFDYAVAWCVAQAPISPALSAKIVEQTGTMLMFESGDLGVSLARTVGLSALVLVLASAVFRRRNL